ncbi:MAG: AAA family ATPase [Janthinobacterium lividum]
MIWPFRRRVSAAAPVAPAPVYAGPEQAARTAPRRPGSVFTPTQPRQGARSLTGRSAELTRILQALGDEQAHVVLYSERGRGKTSLANAAVERLRQGGTVVARYSCEADSTFDSIMLGLVRNLPPFLMPGWAEAGEGCEAALPAGAIRPDDVAALPARLDCRDLVFVVDEFDRVTNQSATARMADTIKQISDRSVPLRFLIVGVSENLEQMLGQHLSIQRNIAAVQLPLLQDAEVAEIISAGSTAVGVPVPVDVVARAVLLARGNPHLSQLLGLRLMQATEMRNGAVASAEDFNMAVDTLIREASPADSGLWTGLTANGTDAEMALALRRLATAEQDRWGRIFAPAEPAGGVRLGEHGIEAGLWQRIEVSGILRPVPAGSGLWVFRQRSLMHYILMLATRMLGNADVATRPLGAPEPSDRTQAYMALR